MYCFKCGQKLMEDAHFCMKCGTKVELGLPNSNSEVAESSSVSSSMQINTSARLTEPAKTEKTNLEFEQSEGQSSSTIIQKANNVRTIKCSNCGSSLVIVDEKIEYTYCEYCGTKQLLDDYRIREHYVDEAVLKRIESEERVKLNNLELEQLQHAHYDKLKKIVAIVGASFALELIILGMVLWSLYDDEFTRFNIVTLCGVIVVVVLLFVGILIFKIIPEKENESIRLRNGGIRFPESSKLLGTYHVAQKTLEELGFKNVQAINMHDLLFSFGITIRGESYKAGEGDIESITVNGEPVNYGGVYMPNDSIIINYHGKRQK